MSMSNRLDTAVSAVDQGSYYSCSVFLRVVTVPHQILVGVGGFPVDSGFDRQISHPAVIAMTSISAPRSQSGQTFIVSMKYYPMFKPKICIIIYSIHVSALNYAFQNEV